MNWTLKTQASRRTGLHDKNTAFTAKLDFSCMFFLFPISIETLERHRPWVNHLILIMTVVAFFASGMGLPLPESWQGWVLVQDNPAGMIGHIFLHIDLLHLAVNMVFLWVFGNVICQTTGNWFYPLLYFGFGLGAAVIHLAAGGGPGVGASGAINGLIGLTVTLFPRNQVNIFYLAGTSRGTFEISVLLLCVVYSSIDLAGAVLQAGQTAYLAHLGGFVIGAATGLLCLHFGWIKLSRHDDLSLYEMITLRNLDRLTGDIDGSASKMPASRQRI